MAAQKLRPGQDKWWSDGDVAAPITPWGRAQHLTKIGPGLAWVMTAGHGGLAVSAGMARKNLSRWALKIGELMGGYYWFEEDVAWSIPYYEVDAWREMDNKFTRGDGGRALSREFVEKTVEHWYKKYYAENNPDERVETLPKKGQVVVFNKDLDFGRGNVIPKGTVAQVDKVTPGKIFVLYRGYRWVIRKDQFDDGYFSVKKASEKMAMNDPATFIPVNLSGGEKIIAYNSSHWQWEYDSDSRYAAVILHTQTNALRMELVATRTSDGLGGGRKRTSTLAKANLGSLQKPALGGLSSILSKHSHDRTRAGGPFTRQWKNAETGKDGPLKGIIESYRETVGPSLSDTELREQLKQNLDKLPMDVVRKLLQRV